MNSKIELRNEAVRIAARLEGVTAGNITEVAGMIEDYMTGDAELPEVMDMKEMARTFANLTAFKFNDKGQQGQA